MKNVWRVIVKLAMVGLDMVHNDAGGNGGDGGGDYDRHNTTVGW